MRSLHKSIEDPLEITRSVLERETVLPRESPKLVGQHYSFGSAQIVYNFLSVSGRTRYIFCMFPRNSMISVRYHCGGWPEEVNTCFLNSYMFYL
jgi:hypothetical protein